MAVVDNTDVKTKTLRDVDAAIAAVRPLINCRAVAELLDRLYRITLAWIAQREPVMQVGTNARRATSDRLDRLLRSYYFYHHHGASNPNAARVFAEASKDKEAISKFTTGDTGQINFATVQIMKPISYAVFSQDPAAGNYARYVFPLIVSDLRIIGQQLSVENAFFHPGLIHSILIMPDEGELPPETIDGLQDLAEYCERITEQLFRNVSSRPAHAVEKLETLVSYAVRLSEMGLNGKTSSMYSDMIVKSYASPQQAFSNADGSRVASVLSSQTYTDVTELKHRIIVLVYNAHMFHLCLERYSPTFLFHNRRRLLLEQRYSVLIGEREELQFVWDNVVNNINRLFYAWFSETEFDDLVGNSSEKDVEYIYRDLLVKWGDILFNKQKTIEVDMEDKSDTKSKPEAKEDAISPTEIREICRSLREKPIDDVLDVVMAITKEPGFLPIFLEAYVIPEYEDALDMDYTKYSLEGTPKLLQLIYLTKLLIPDQLQLSQGLVQVYNLTQFVSRLDVGLFKLLHDASQTLLSIFQNLSPQAEIRRTFSLLGELLITAIVNEYKEALEPLLGDVIPSGSEVLQQYAEHTKRCTAISMSTAKTEHMPQRIGLYFENVHIMTVQLSEVRNTCETLVRKNKNLFSAATSVEQRIEHTNAVLNALSKRIEPYKQALAGELFLRDHVKSVKTIESSLKTTHEKLKTVLEESEKSNRLVTDAVIRILKLVSIISTENLQRFGVADCIAEANGLIQASSRITAPPKPTKEQEETISRHIISELLHDTFQASTETPKDAAKEQTQDNGRSMTEQVDDMSSETASYGNVVSDKYMVPKDYHKALLGWYIETSQQAKDDLLSPILSKLTAELNTSSPIRSQEEPMTT
ncbi:GP47 [Caviid betaherpesvirus 2]|uniref:GP47 n=1 Tax=Guinea pig cytomegalovirus (strain 22122) TaxID=103920 RepID=E9RH62_GPCMV|nr:GP47 [Caviid betaherpesvirus 2]AGE11524.1 GP47 [Caviid betaherpesvirus 2]AIL83912.1 GP47 [BAC cloning vector GPN13BACdenovo_preserved(MM)]BAJ78514.1 GP47 [Caviid betaherpesvirus 2]